METNGNISCLRQLLDEDSNRLMSGEVQLKNSILGWISNDCEPTLKMIMRHYLDLIERHVRQLEAFCEQEQLLLLPGNNRIIMAFSDEVDEKLLNCSCQEVRDACLLAGIQAIAHFKISAYGTAAAFAWAAGQDKAAALFHRAEADEKSIDDELSRLARYRINTKAIAPLVLSQS